MRLQAVHRDPRPRGTYLQEQLLLLSDQHTVWTAYVASNGPMTAPSRTYTWDASWTPTTLAFSASLAGLMVLGISTLAGVA